MGKSAKRANGDGSIRKRSVLRNGKTYTFWEGVVTVGYDPGTGKQQRRTFTGKTQKDVAEKMRDAASQVDRGEYFEAGKMTLKQWFETWLAEYCGDKKYLTVKQYRSMAETHIYPALGAVKLAKLTSPQIQKFYNELGRTGKTVRERDEETGEMAERQEPLSAKTIRNIHGILSKCLNTAIDQGVIRNNPTERVTVPKVIKQEIQPLTEEQQRAFLKAIEGHPLERLYTVILFTGLREGEAIGLTWDCIDFSKRNMKVYRQLQKRPVKDGGYTFAPLKNDRIRNITLAPYVLTMLENQKKDQEARQKALGELWQGWKDEEEKKTALVFTNEQGGHLSVVTVYNTFKALVTEIGAPACRVHDLRHTFAVNSLQSGDDFKTVQDNLGHATAAFTLDVYGHVSERMKEDSARRQQAWIESLRAKKQPPD